MTQKRAMLGAVVFDVVEGENIDFPNDVSERAVEDGTNVSDHVRNAPIAFAITGVVTGPDAGHKRQQLVKYRNDRQLLRYVGRNVLENMVIENLSTAHNVENFGGFAFRIELKQVRVVTTRTVSFVKPDPARPASTNKAAVSTQTQDWSDAGLRNKLSQPQQAAVAQEQKQSLLSRAADAIKNLFSRTKR